MYKRAATLHLKYQKIYAYMLDGASADVVDF